MSMKVITTTNGIIGVQADPKKDIEEIAASPEVRQSMRDQTMKIVTAYVRSTDFDRIVKGLLRETLESVVAEEVGPLVAEASERIKSQVRQRFEAEAESVVRTKVDRAIDAVRRELAK